MTAAWSPDFFTKLCKALPNEFKDLNTIRMRGVYQDLVDFNVYKIVDPSFPGMEVYSFELNKKSKKIPTLEALINFLSDVRGVATRCGLKELKTPSELADTPHSFVLVRTKTTIRLFVNY